MRREKNRINRTERIMPALFLGLALCYMLPLAVRAKEDAAAQIAECSVIMTAAEDLDAKESPDASSETVVSYRKGDSIFVTGELPDGWYRVQYQDTTGYVETAKVAKMNVDVEALDQEFESEQEKGGLFVEEVERHRAEAKRSRLWGTVIAVLVAGIFATSIVSACRNRRKGESE